MKFKVGDIIVGTTRPREVYGYTTSEAVMVVRDIRADGPMSVEIIEHKRDGNIGDRYWVAPEHFKLKKPISLENK